jgi:TRAP transporter TAXI family solute receptor
MGTAPVGGAFPVVGGAICEVLNDHKSVIDWKLSPKGTKGSQENIRRLQQNELELGMSNAAISYFAARGEAGWNEKFDIRSVATLAPNVAMFITRADSGVRTISDLKGKRVIIGPAGAGFQMFVEPILAEHGVAWNEISSLDATQSDSVDLLADGSADAAFLGGAIPTASITQATSTFDVHFIPYDETARKALVEKYAFFDDAKIPAGTYKGLDVDFAGLNVGSMHLITAAAQDEELIYQVTKAIWENREEIAAQHAAGKAINPANVARDVGVEYHPGAIRFYKEAGVWPGSEPTDAASQPEATSQPEAAAPEAESSDAEEKPVGSAS